MSKTLQTQCRRVEKLLQRGTARPALTQARRLVRQAPDDPQVLALLARACDLSGDAAGATRALGRLPQDAGLRAAGLIAHGGWLLAQDMPDRAGALFEQMLDIAPEAAEGWNGLGAARLRQGVLDEAVGCFARAVSLDQSSPTYLENLGHTLARQGSWAEAEAALELSLRLDSSPARVRRAADLFLSCEAPDRALPLLQRLVTDRPDDADAHNDLGLVLKSMGDRTGAEAHLARAVELAPGDARFLYNLSTVRRFGPEDPLLVTPPAEPAGRQDRALHHFARAKALDDIGDTARAYAGFRQANALAAPASIDLPALVTLPVTPAPRSTGPRPIFIVGLPRSGSSLVEQILSRLPGVAAMGERDWLARAISAAQSKDGIDGACVADRYVAQFPEAARAARFVTDKMPDNALRLPVIRAALPGAVVLHVHRDPRAVGWSIFRSHFTRGGAVLGYASDHTAILTHLQQHWQAMAGWEAQWPGAVFHVDYAALVRAPGKVMQGVCAHIGLPWSDAALTAKQGGAAIRTASALQADQPIYRGSDAAWQKYAPFAPEWFAELDALRREIAGWPAPKAGTWGVA